MEYLSKNAEESVRDENDEKEGDRYGRQEWSLRIINIRGGAYNKNKSDKNTIGKKFN